MRFVGVVFIAVLAITNAISESFFNESFHQKLEETMNLLSTVQTLEALRKGFLANICHPPWMQTVNGMCLLSEEIWGSWDIARDFCLEENADLAFPENPREADVMLQVVQVSSPPRTDFWLNMRREENASVFVHADRRVRTWLPQWVSTRRRIRLNKSSCIYCH